MDDRNGMPMDDSNNTDAAAEPASADLSQFYGTAKDVVAKYTHCSLCGGHLHFTHVTDFHRNLTQETAKCPECGTHARRILHKLQ